MKKHYETHVEDTDKLISVAGPILEYKSWYEQYRKLMEEQAQRKYGLYTPTSEGDDDFPSVTGMIARYSALGLTNEQMAENPVWKDLTGNGHDLQMKNFAWKGMSGVGGYGDENYQTFYKFTLDDYVFIASPPGVEHMNFTFRVTGLQPGNKLTLAFFGTTNTVYGTWDKDGIYTVDADIVEAGKPTYFYNGYGATRGEFTIEILPLYPGALVFDGVDDYGVCDNFPILTKEKGYTVVALRKWLTPETKTISEVLLGNFKNNPIWTSANFGAFQFEIKYNVSKKVQTDSFGIGNNITLNNNHLFSYQISNSYNGSILRLGSNVGGNFFTVGCGGDQFYANAAIWELVFLDHDATEEELTKIKDYFVKTYPWLFPDQAWTVTGKTNEDEDRATIANITGNGNDLVLSNFGFIEGSGYNEEGEYAGYLVTDGVDDKIISSNFKFGENYTVVGEWEFLQEASNVVAGFMKNPNYCILYNYKDGINTYIKADDQATFISGVRSIKALTSKGDIYPDFNSYVKIEPGKRIETNYPLYIGFNPNVSSNNFTKLAFKNLVIYSEVLSKEDCIKAYNYLQTLKAK